MRTCFRSRVGGLGLKVWGLGFRDIRVIMVIRVIRVRV